MDDRPQLQSSIYLKNVVETDPVTVTPILHLSNGAKYNLADITVKLAGLAIISINDELQKKGISPWATLSGYVELQYMWPWDPFCATVRNVDTAHSVIFTYSLRPALPLRLPSRKTALPVPTNTMEGMWWKHEKNVIGFIAVANLSSEAAQTSIEIIDGEAKPISQHQLNVSPHGMKLIKLPELQTVEAVQGGVRITSSQTMDKLVINGGLEDQSIGYSASMPFAQQPVTPSDPQQITIAELGLMTGAADPMMLFPAGTTFTPYSVLRNVSDQPLSLVPTLWWMEGAKPRSARLPEVNLAPHETRSVDVPSMLAHFGPSNFNGSFNIEFATQARLGSLLMSSGSVDQTGTYVFKVMPRGVAESMSRSLQQWSTDNGDDTMVTVWNPADEAQDFTFTLLFEGGHYLLPLHMQARETRSFNVSEIIQNQVPDAEGNVIPPSIRQGTAKIGGSQAENEYILIAVDAAVYNVRKATCGVICLTCNGYTNSAVVLSSFSVPVTGTNQLVLYGTLNTGGQSEMYGTWSSSKTTVATVGSSNGIATGVGAGSATLSVFTANEMDGSGYTCFSEINPTCPESSFGRNSSAQTANVTISGVSFSSGLALGAQGVMTITGSNFTAYPGQLNVGFAPAGISVTNAVAQNGSEITAGYQVTCATSLGSQTLTVNFAAADGGSGAGSNPWVVSVTLPAALTPTIQLNGTTVSGTQSVVVGQQIKLTGSVSLPACMSISSQQ
jgi:hypothetical protein